MISRREIKEKTNALFPFFTDLNYSEKAKFFASGEKISDVIKGKQLMLNKCSKEGEMKENVLNVFKSFGKNGLSKVPSDMLFHLVDFCPFTFRFVNHQTIEYYKKIDKEGALRLEVFNKKFFFSFFGNEPINTQKKIKIKRDIRWEITFPEDQVSRITFVEKKDELFRFKEYIIEKMYVSNHKRRKGEKIRRNLPSGTISSFRLSREWTIKEKEKSEFITSKEHVLRETLLKPVTKRENYNGKIRNRYYGRYGRKSISRAEIGKTFDYPVEKLETPHGFGELYQPLHAILYRTYFSVICYGRKEKKLFHVKLALKDGTIQLTDRKELEYFSAEKEKHVTYRINIGDKILHKNGINVGIVQRDCHYSGNPHSAVRSRKNANLLEVNWEDEKFGKLVHRRDVYVIEKIKRKEIVESESDSSSSTDYSSEELE